MLPYFFLAGNYFLFGSNIRKQHFSKIHVRMDPEIFNEICDDGAIVQVDIETRWLDRS